MKTCVPFFLSFVICLFVKAQNTDLPSPTSNLQILTAGSYVIPMDNTLQTDNVIGAGNFNLKVYGLVVHLLNNKVKVKWVIKAGKTKDGIDFTGIAEQIKPGYAIAALRNFIAGPFVIFAADTTGVAALVDGYYSTSGLTGNNRPKVFRLTASVLNVDIRFDMTSFIPKAAILTDGNNQAVHIGYMTAAGITTANYATSTGNDLLASCFTFASEPHNDQAGASLDGIIGAIKSFVRFGGNFLAQCEAVVNYENHPAGRFQTTTGVTKQNDNIGTALSYPNPDLGFSQFHGSYNASQGGSLRNWRINTTGANNEHHHANGTGVFTATLGASVSKMIADTGGLVFYIGNHEFNVSDGVAGINGIRMYMNAFLAPVTINQHCNTAQALVIPLPLKLISFNAALNKTKIDLTWTTSEEINTSHFVVERSYDGIRFAEAGVLFAYNNSNELKNYAFADNITNSQAAVIYYRLRFVDTDNKFSYSATRIIKTISKEGSGMTVLAYPNPANSELFITIPVNWQNKKVLYEIVNSSGQVIKKAESSVSSQTETINVSSLRPGLYIVRVDCNNESKQHRIIKQ